MRIDGWFKMPSLCLPRFPTFPRRNITWVTFAMRKNKLLKNIVLFPFFPIIPKERRIEVMGKIRVSCEPIADCKRASFQSRGRGDEHKSISRGYLSLLSLSATEPISAEPTSRLLEHSNTHMTSLASGSLHSSEQIQSINKQTNKYMCRCNKVYRKI